MKATEGVADAQFRLLVDNVRDYAIFLLDAEGFVRSWNPGAERIKGYRAHEIVGRHFSLFYPPEQVANGHFDFMLQRAREEGRVEEENWRLRKDGTRFWADVVITCLRDDQGRVIGYGKVTRDLTDRRRMEESLRQSEERHRLLVDSVRDYAIFMLDATGRVRSWNAGAVALKGYRAEEVLGQHFRLFYPPEDVAAGKPERELATAMAEGRAEDEGWRVRKDGTRFWANVVITALFDDSGSLRGFGKVTRDLTEHRRLEQERLAHLARQEEVERLSAINRFKTQFINAAAHELNTPLTPILLQLDLLQTHSPLDPEVARSLGILRRNVERLQSLVADLLDVARLESAKLQLRLTPTPLGPLLTETEESFQEPARRAGLTLDVHCPSLPPVEGDARRIVQVLSNLVGNALKFTPAGGRIALTAEARGKEVLVRVEDNGIGIAPEDVPRLFTPFTQLPRKAGPAPSGTGLGLYIAKGIVQAHGGRMGVDSKGPGKGTAFWFTLPVASEGPRP